MRGWVFNFRFMIVGLLLATSAAHAQIKTEGPYKVETGEYKYAAQVQPDVLSDRKTELWARVFWPVDSSSGKIPSSLPLVVFLHGNHGTCGTGLQPRIDDLLDYTDTGACPEGYTVVPSHEGYNYIAEQLASYGYIVFSINANRGITGGYGTTGDSGLNLARGRLILKHLELWNSWNSSATAPLSLKNNAELFKGKIDFKNVGLMGHSRGGEGVRAAYNLYYDVGSPWPAKIPQMIIKGIFEIAAVDKQTYRTLNAEHVVWNQLIPVCDGDVSNFAGIGPFNRMMQSTSSDLGGAKSVYIVYGANHNFFNTEWQENDSSGCYNHKALWSVMDYMSQQQQYIGQRIVVDFFRSNVGDSLYKLINALDPLNTVVPEVSTLTQIERDFSSNPNLRSQYRFDDFIAGTTDVLREASEGLKFSVQKGRLDLAGQLNINWSKDLTTTTSPYLILSKTQPINVSSQETLDFRFSLSGKKINEVPLNLKIQLVDMRGAVSKPVMLTDYLTKSYNPFYSLLYQTVRIPLKKIKEVNLEQIKSIRFEFAQPERGEIYLAHVRFSAPVDNKNARSISQKNEYSGIVSPVEQTSQAPYVQDSIPDSQLGPETRTFYKNQSNKIVKAKVLTSNSHTGLVDVAITFSSLQKFKIQNSLPILEIAGRTFERSKISRSAKNESLITFYIPFSDFMEIRNEDAAFKIFSYENVSDAWMFDNTLSTIGVN